MKDKDWCRRIEDEIDRLIGRVKKLEDGSPGHRCRNQNQETIELEINWPEADIGGLHFNAQKTRSVFELKEDGNYYSRDILFNSARDTDAGTGLDLLTEYLESEEVRAAFYTALKDFHMGIFFSNEIHDSLKIFLPEENQGIKKYNGVSWRYWLQNQYSGSAAYFAYVAAGGYTDYGSASAVGGCAPAFCIAQRHDNHGKEATRPPSRDGD